MPSTEPQVGLAIRDSGVATRRVLPAALLAIFAAQCLWFVGTQSFTVDEPTNLAIGIKHWRGLRKVGDDNPPLLRMLCALPLLGSAAEKVAASEFEDEPTLSGENPAGHGWASADPIAVAWRTRPMNVALGVLLGIALWQAARRRFSVGAANFALALFAFSPPLIAHFSIIGTDGIAALMIFITALQVTAFRRHPSWRQALVTGVVLGLLLLAKLYTLPMFALALLLVTLPSPAHLRIWSWRWGKALLMVAISFLLVWACYWFRVSDLVVRDHQVWLEHRGVLETLRYPAPVGLNFSVPLPAADFVHSIVFQLKHGREGHPAYLLGKVSEHGWRYYYPVAIALKWPTVVLGLGLAAAVLALLPTCAKTGQMWGTLGVRLPRDFGTIFLFPISFFALAIFSTVNIGERYVLAVYPFLLLAVAGLYEQVRRFPAGGGARRDDVFVSIQGSPGGAPGPTEIRDQDSHPVAPSRFASGQAPAGATRVGHPVLVTLLICAAGLNAADVLRFAPDYLSYFTIFVPQRQSWRYLSDSSLDWGQGLIALRKYERRHPDTKLHAAYWSNGIGPDRYGIEAVPFGEKERPRGTVIVSPGALSGQYNDDPVAYRWVLAYPIKAVLGHDFLVFEVPR